MPKENIERAIQKGIGAGGGAAIEEIVYEAYAPNGIGLLIECLTDNKNRTLGEIKAVLNKSAGSLASAGSVAYQFKRVGQIVIDETKNSVKGDDLEMIILDSGASDFEKEEDVFIVTCDFSAMHSVRKYLEDNNIVIESSDFVYQTDNLITLPDDKKESILSFIDKIEDLDDINAVFTNLSM